MAPMSQPATPTFFAKLATPFAAGSTASRSAQAAKKRLMAKKRLSRYCKR
jgi:hypothetical protein